MLRDISYAEAIGSVMYAMVCTISDIAYAINIPSRYMMKLKLKHQKAIKGLLRYIKGKINVGLEFGKYIDFVNIIGYSDVDFAKYFVFRRSTSSFILIICGYCIFWKITFTI